MRNPFDRVLLVLLAIAILIGIALIVVGAQAADPAMPWLQDNFPATTTGNGAVIGAPNIANDRIVTAPLILPDNSNNPPLSLAVPAEPNEWQQIINFFIENFVKPLLAVVIPVIASMLVGLLVTVLRKHGVDLDQARTTQFELAAKKSLEWSLSTAFKQIESLGPDGWTSEAVRNTVIAKAKDYMLERFPSAVKGSLGNASLDTINNKTDPLMMRLYPKVVTEIAASPASPPAQPSQTAVPVVEVGGASKS